ncbi:hypothetical protein EVAR_25563_1 [Eumeta japonica]|uniref:Uncharacterized protein n=1 Tax=Eumeta variegata TaxID=151549 RepID=A0A4C1Z5I7_EUMVA|nr:hypothetical protein EVAR_25563_1 [Eumeta japonica]
MRCVDRGSLFVTTEIDSRADHGRKECERESGADNGGRGGHWEEIAGTPRGRRRRRGAGGRKRPTRSAQLPPSSILRMGRAKPLSSGQTSLARKTSMRSMRES